ncbi:FAD-dependent oxidoreductase [Streptomyces aureus]|uniref:FAD-dependent oxidoreductase n=1 Tax=Streptomyces aureus TaxID=193461 RepID=UPI003630171B
MASHSVVVVGAGLAGLDTAAALRGRGYEGRITLVGDEPSGPCDRPPLSKGYLAGTTAAADIALRPPSFYAAQDIQLLSGDRASSVDRERRTVLLESGLRLPYGALVLATGCRPRTLPVPGASLAGVLCCAAWPTRRTCGCGSAGRPAASSWSAPGSSVSRWRPPRVASATR